ncbi:MAG: alpha/beta fold hydrolase [Methylocystis sp.]|nr:alpha/beta fold hydrolase [Methylocystis sp.]MCA3583724.1 alpha/beta fold hydrolase [Methylocystis sp.]MCA3587736.1 alpha/beta fold hydrolase [Methylocystis sp.]MCA3590002.1 alpha/beta fold hydrolase [Methylocystis sp.]
MTARLDFERDGQDWPNRAASRFILAGDVRFHVQVMGDGPVMLLLHGTGASTHSWRGLLPLLAKHYTIVAPDLPGHGFSDYLGMNGLSITGMAASIQALLRKLGLEPGIAVGHSAGAAILVRMALDRQIRPELIISLNGALAPFGGFIGQFFSPVARMLATLPLLSMLFARRARDPDVIRDILKQTGSKLDPEGIALYSRLAGNAEHVTAALGMMANWDLLALERDMPRLQTPLALVSGLRDQMVRPDVAREVAARVPSAFVVPVAGLGHLAHEEAPGRIAELILGLAEGERPARAPLRPARNRTAGMTTSIAGERP